MFKRLLVAATAAALIAAPVAPAFAQQATTDKKPAATPAAKPAATPAAKPLTAQQQKMKDCAPKWAAYKKEKNVKGIAEHNKFMSSCLKGLTHL